MWFKTRSKGSAHVIDETVYEPGLGLIIPKSIVFDAHCRNFAYAQWAAHGCCVVAGREQGPPYTEILAATPIISARGLVAYGGRKSNQWFVVLNGVEGPPHDGLGANSLHFGSVGARFAHTAYDGGKWTVIVDQYPTLAVESTIARTFVFSSDEKRWAILARDRGRVACFVDGEAVGTYEEPSRDAPIFSSDGAHIAFLGQRDGSWFVNVDGSESRAFESVGGFTFSPIGNGFAYAAKQNGKWFVVIDEHDTGHFDEVARSSPQYSESGKIVYGARNEQGWLVFRNGETVVQAEALGARTPRFIPRSESIAVIEVRASGMQLSIDGVPLSRTFTGITDLVFSLNGKRMAYAAAESQFSWMQVVDGVCGVTYEKVEPVLFSADAQHYAYRAWKNGKPRIVVDGVECSKGRWPWGLAPLAWDGNILRTFFVDNGRGVRSAITPPDVARAASTAAS